MTKRFNINHLLSFDEAGNVKPLTTEQLLDADVREFYNKYYVDNKLESYARECGYIYYLADPNSPPRQEGLSDKECIARAKHEFHLPAMYQPSPLVQRIMERYRESEMTILNEAAVSLEQSVHSCILISNKYREILQAKMEQLDSSGTPETITMITAIVGIVQQINKEIKDFPKLVDTLKAAKEAIFAEAEDMELRGGILMTESMNANSAVK
jgi:hypothetical protein